MSYDPQNVFARILRGELPCVKLYEDAHTLAFMDLMPQADGHALVIPREAAATLPELSEDAAVACIRVVHRLARAAQTATGCPGLWIMQSNGKAAGQTVPHVHFHIIPRYDGQPLRAHGAQREDAAKLEALAARIRSALGETG
jgi:histidine triad (HIT) family protein